MWDTDTIILVCKIKKHRLCSLCSSSGNSSFYTSLEEPDEEGVVQNAPTRISSRSTKNKRNSAGSEFNQEIKFEVRRVLIRSGFWVQNSLFFNPRLMISTTARVLDPVVHALTGKWVAGGYAKTSETDRFLLGVRQGWEPMIFWILHFSNEGRSTLSSLSRSP